MLRKTNTNTEGYDFDEGKQTGHPRTLSWFFSFFTAEDATHRCMSPGNPSLSLKITSTSSTTFDPAGLRQGSPANQRPASIRIESEDQPKQCLAGEEEQKEKAKPTADEEEKTRKERLLNVSWGRGRKKGEVEDE